MTLRFTPRQYRTLLKMMWISSRVVQGSELTEDPELQEMLELAKSIFDQAGAFNADDILLPRSPLLNSYDEEEPMLGEPAMPGFLRLQPDTEEELMAILEWYEEFSFWEILEDRLAMRDIADERSEAQWEWLPEQEKDRMYFEHLNYYYEEFSDNGLQNLRFVAPDPDKPQMPWSWNTQTDTGAAPGPETKNFADRKGKIIDFPGNAKPPRKSDK